MVIFAGSDGVRPVSDKLAQQGVYVKQAEKLTPNLADGLILPIGVEKGFVSHTNKLAVIGTKGYRQGLSRRDAAQSKKTGVFVGGKGRLRRARHSRNRFVQGIQKITSPTGEVKDYIVVMYRHGDRLYVPVDASDMLSRYSGEKIRPFPKSAVKILPKLKTR